MKYLFSLLSLLFLTTCTSRKNTEYMTIKYESGACFGFCPIYKMTINADRSAIFEAERFNFSRDTDSQENEGNFKGTIDAEKYSELMEKFAALKAKNLKNFYGNKNVTDLPTAYLTITYPDGTVKKIEDYGKHGTPQLQKLYEFFDSLRTSETWSKIE
ncbi:hypothetical protein OA84_06405 [Kaistella solincola]|uniref:DUF6438 domain-containing protein n=1 Tax=Kaistella solincola TaxID=510955 RepID=A0ABR4ZPF3_9FLAO|nr:DUF6438 domain-containing protein [Kaistella solincola]KIA83178.1 hypothetical protein OA84_06405 [Kaistella solincola]